MDTDTPAIFGGVWDLHVVEVVEEMSWILCDRLMPQKNTDVLVSDGYDAYIALWDGIKEARKIFRDTRKGTHMIVNKDDFEYLLDEVDRKLTLKHSEVRVVE